ncbi:hypothetical protein GCM10009555_020400 [Acrocarpospora macrocephala]|uniref:Uncharacterized protein n=1 Tax=Acrocarpospora macrocephala TaxID=150177 RepID=A0A5M3WI09_9ACTN|nr:hypothetical protein Amac_015550 [Acrocarpospora macrocephala]
MIFIGESFHLKVSFDHPPYAAPVHAQMVEGSARHGILAWPPCGSGLVRIGKMIPAELLAVVTRLLDWPWKWVMADRARHAYPSKRGSAPGRGEFVLLGSTSQDAPLSTMRTGRECLAGWLRAPSCITGRI